MTIILMRHGKPDHPATGRVSARALAEWCAAYDRAVICDVPPPRSRAIAHQASVVATSPLPRARASVTRLGLQADTVDAVFQEVALPLLPHARPQLPLTLWLALLRLLWLCGYAGQVESVQHARARACRAADRLVALSQHGTVLLLGHGIMNKLIARELRRRGWQAEKHASSRHWSSAIYHRPFI